MPFVQVSVRQTEYTSTNELQIQNEATLSYNNSISIFPVPSDATQSVIVSVCVCVYDELMNEYVCEKVKSLPLLTVAQRGRRTGLPYLNGWVRVPPPLWRGSIGTDWTN